MVRVTFSLPLTITSRSARDGRIGTLGRMDGYAEIVRLVLAAMDADIRPLSDRQLLLPIATVHALQASLDAEGKTIAIANMLGRSLLRAHTDFG